MIKYNRLRIQANRRHKDTLGDSFHDGFEVLPEVTHWHEYLRRLARKSDNLTRRVLDLVDKKMLVGQVELRAETSDICKLMVDQIHEQQNGVPWDDLTPGFETFLDEVEGLVETQFTGLDGTTYYLSGNERSPSPTMNSEFKSTHELLSQPVLPVILRAQQPRTGDPVSRTPSSMGSLQRSQQSRQSLQSYQSSGRPNTMVSLITTSTTNVRGVTNMWMVEAELERHNKASKLTRMLRRSPKARSIRATKQRSSRDELGNHYEYRDIVSLPYTITLRFLMSLLGLPCGQWPYDGTPLDTCE